MSTCPNPFAGDGGWYWHDETGEPYGPYKTEEKALSRLVAYCNYLENGPTLWQRIWLPIRNFWLDDSSGAKVNQRGAVAKGDIVGRDKIEL